MTEPRVEAGGRALETASLPKQCVVCGKDCHHEGRKCTCIQRKPKTEACRALELARKIHDDCLACDYENRVAPECEQEINRVAELIQSAMNAQERELREATIEQCAKATRCYKCEAEIVALKGEVDEASSSI